MDIPAAKKNKKNVIKTNIDVDFLNNLVEVYVYVVERTTSAQEVKRFDPKTGKNECIQISIFEKVLNESSKLLFCKRFYIAEDFKSVTIEGKTFEIPAFYNHETVASKDSKIWEMIFYGIFADKISKSIQEKLTGSVKDELWKFQAELQAPDK